MWYKDILFKISLEIDYFKYEFLNGVMVFCILLIFIYKIE